MECSDEKEHGNDVRSSGSWLNPFSFRSPQVHTDLCLGRNTWIDFVSGGGIQLPRVPFLRHQVGSKPWQPLSRCQTNRPSSKKTPRAVSQEPNLFSSAIEAWQTYPLRSHPISDVCLEDVSYQQLSWYGPVPSVLGTEVLGHNEHRW